MQHRKRTALIAGLFTITCLAQISMNTMSGISADAAGSYDMAVTVNLAGEKKAISPHIYGVNDSGDGSNLKNVTVDTVRQGVTTQTVAAMPAEDCLQPARKTTSLTR